MLLDYTTCYLGAVPMKKATTKNIARKLFPLFSRVGIPGDILTDQGKTLHLKTYAGGAQPPVGLAVTHLSLPPANQWPGQNV